MSLKHLRMVATATKMEEITRKSEKRWSRWKFININMISRELRVCKEAASSKKGRKGTVTKVKEKKTVSRRQWLTMSSIERGKGVSNDYTICQCTSHRWP